MAKYTLTMARLYAEQGYLRKAAELYRQLIEQQPERSDLRDALAQVQRQIERQPVPSKKELILMFREWIDLMGEVNQRRRSIQDSKRREK
jgi:outer membrane protein assembly factor BamD (BamD/ComL family)